MLFAQWRAFNRKWVKRAWNPSKLHSRLPFSAHSGRSINDHYECIHIGKMQCDKRFIVENRSISLFSTFSLSLSLPQTWVNESHFVCVMIIFFCFCYSHNSRISIWNDSELQWCKYRNAHQPWRTFTAIWITSIPFVI